MASLLALLPLLTLTFASLSHTLPSNSSLTSTANPLTSLATAADNLPHEPNTFASQSHTLPSNSSLTSTATPLTSLATAADNLPHEPNTFASLSHTLPSNSSLTSTATPLTNLAVAAAANLSHKPNTVLPSSLAATAADNPAVRLVMDTAGKPLRAGEEYEVISLDGGHLGISGRKNQFCPSFITVTTAATEVSVVFSLVRTGKNIPVFADVKMDIHAITICVTTTSWTVVEDGSTSYVTSDGARGSIFRILTASGGAGYQIAYCPQDECMKLGKVEESGEVFLGFPGEPLPVKFKKV